MSVKGKNDNVLTMELYQASQINEVKLGGTIDNLSIREGGIKNEDTGERWSDSYYVDFSYKGGKMSVRVTASVYQDLEVGKTYQYIGRVTMKNPKGEGQPYPTLDFIRFDYLF